MSTNGKNTEAADIQAMLNGALTDISTITKHVQAALEDFQKMVNEGSADVQAWVNRTLASLQQAQGCNQRIEWEISAAATYLRNILRQSQTQTQQ